MTNAEFCEKMIEWVFENIIPWVIVFMMAVFVLMFIAIVITGISG